MWQGQANNSEKPEGRQEALLSANLVQLIRCICSPQFKLLILLCPGLTVPCDGYPQAVSSRYPLDACGKDITFIVALNCSGVVNWDFQSLSMQR